MKKDVLRDRLLSLTIVLTMITSSFAGFLVLGASPLVQGLEPSQLDNGDLIIGSDYDISEFSIMGSIYHMDGNLKVRKGGILTIENAELSFDQDIGPDGIPGSSDDRRYTLTVEDGGMLIVRNSVITTSLDEIHDFPSLGFIARNGAYIEIVDSVLRFPGFILVDDSTLIMRGSSIEGHSTNDITQYCNNQYFPAEAYDDSAVVLLASSDVFLYDSAIDNIFEGAVNSSIYPLIDTHNYYFASDTKDRNTVDYTLARNPSELGAGNDCIGQELENLTMDDALLFTVEPTWTLGIDMMDLAGLQFDGPGVTVTLYVKYMTDAGYAGNGAFRWGYENDVMQSTTIVPSDTSAPFDPLVNQEVVESAVLPSMSEADLALINITFNNNDVGGHNVYVNRVWVTVEFSINAYRNLTGIGSTDLTATNTYISVDFSDDPDIHNTLVLQDRANSYLYGSYFDESETIVPRDRETAIYCSDSQVAAKPLAKGPGDDTGQSIVNLLSEDTIYYTIQTGETMAIDEFNVSAFDGEITGVTLRVRYYTAALYSGIDWIQYGLEGQPLQNTAIGIENQVSLVTETCDLYVEGVDTLEEIQDLNIALANTGGSNINIESLWIQIEFSPTVYIYRWLDITTTDSQEIPVEGAIVDATVTSEEVPAYYYTPDGIQLTPPDYILDYIGKDVLSYKETDNQGKAYFPLLAEVVNEATLPNSRSLGYTLNATYTNGTGFDFYELISLGFSAYPDMSEEAQTESTTVQITSLVFIEFDIILSGTETLTISSTIYKHVGNIILRDNSVLTIEESTLSILQQGDNQYQIIVEDAASFILVNSTLNSNYNLDVHLYDGAIMMVDPSVINGTITIVLDGNSELTIIDSEISAEIVAPSTSNAVMTAIDSNFLAPLTNFGGNAVAHLTSVNAPVLAALENAVIYHYRWLDVMVLDGNLEPIEGAYVELQFYVNQTYYSSSITDSEGLVNIECLCDKITATSTRFYGNYRVNATYWYDSVNYESDSFVTVSFDPYSPPLTRNDLSIDIEISSALPDLTPTLAASVLDPARGEAVGLQANVSNVGIVDARDVLVRFLDNQTVIYDYVVQVIDPAETVQINFTWIADYPIGWHNISVVIDPYGDIQEYNKTNNTDYVWVEVRGVPDLEIDSQDITFTPDPPSTNSTAIVTVVVHNIGDVAAENVNVSIYDTPPVGEQEFVGYALIDQINAGASSQTTIEWTPNMPGYHSLTIIVDEDDLIEEPPNANNVVNLTVFVQDYADLTPVAIIFFPSAQIEVGELLEIEVDVKNQGEATATDVLVRFWLGEPVTGEIIDEVIIASIPKDFIQPAVGLWQANTSDYQKMETRLISVQVNPEQTVKEKDYSNDNISATISVIDHRPNFMFVESLQILKEGVIVDNASIGETVNIITAIKNDGLSAALGVEVTIYAIDNDSFVTHIATFTRDISADGTVQINITWVVNTTMGINDIMVWVNPDRTIDERIYSNDMISTDFNVNPPEPYITISLGGITEYNPDTNVFVQGTVKNQINDEPLKDLSVAVYLTRADGTKVGETVVTTTSDSGFFQASIYIPPGEEGDHYINVDVQLAGDIFHDDAPIYVIPIHEEAVFPWWIWVLIIVIVAGVIIGFSLYLYKYGLGKMVECGECGALIPENSKKCPKCGVEFETGTAKCSECGAWIPSTATVCPECGAKFIGRAIEEEEDQYIKTMREQYEAMLDEKREVARQELGSKYSDSRFITWWKKQPDYISFENWLSEQEEKRKTGAFPCPVCGTLNPRGSSICHKCGTVFETKIAEKEEPVKRPLRRIVRKPAGKKPPEEGAAEVEETKEEESTE